jgi:hypothetical protein
MECSVPLIAVPLISSIISFLRDELIEIFLYNKITKKRIPLKRI